MNIYPFFIECSKQYTNEPYKCKLLQQFSLGKGGGFILKKQDSTGKVIHVLLTPNGEFIIPARYTDKARLELESKLWEKDKYSRLQNEIKLCKSHWINTKKKEKAQLLLKYASIASVHAQERYLLYGLYMLILLLKLLKPSDISFADNEIKSISGEYTKESIYQLMDFSYDYSSNIKSKKDKQSRSRIEEDEDE